MPPGTRTTTLVEDLVAALSDKKVIEVVSNIFEQKLQSVLQTVSELKKENNNLSVTVAELQQNLTAANEKIEALENYTRKDNLIIDGLPLVSYAEAASSGTTSESSEVTEESVLKFANTALQVPLQKSDISIAHRMGKPQNNSPPRIIVRFTNRAARNAMYGARRKLRDYQEQNGMKIYVNEDLTAHTADLFRRARQMVKQKRFHSCWTSGGTVYVKKTFDRDSRPIKLSLSSDLQSL